MKPNLTFEHYRIIDADYAFVGLKSVMGCMARKAVDSLRCEGLRVGAVALEERSPLSIDIANLLAQLRAVGVLESGLETDRLGPGLVDLLRRASATAEWYAPGRIPRVYSAVLDAGSVALREEHFTGLAKAMHKYAPEPILFTADGLAKPASRISTRIFAEVA